MSARLTAGPDVAGSGPDGAEPQRAPRPAPLALARMHLRLGSLALARTELEILATDGALDAAGQVDLAEARWRTGDLAAAGAAAAAAIEAGEDGPVALAIAAEAASALGRPNEARRLSSRAMERVGGSIDDLFGGMPRSGVWPADADEPPPTASTLFHHDPAADVRIRAGDTDPGVSAARGAPGDEQDEPVAPSPQTVGFWDTDGAIETPRNDLPDPAGELDAAHAALRAGSVDEAVLRFTLALRLAPALAPAILEATDGVPGPAVSVVRGDAYRQVGLEAEARRAYAAASWSGARDRRGRGRRSRAGRDARSPQAQPESTPEEDPAAPTEAGSTPAADPAAPTEAVASPAEGETTATDA